MGRPGHLVAVAANPRIQIVHGNEEDVRFLNGEGCAGTVGCEHDNRKDEGMQDLFHWMTFRLVCHNVVSTQLP
jgi:hypothetical protein